MRKALKPFAYLAALIPFVLPRSAQADTTIDTAKTTPFATSSTGNLTITSTGSIIPTSAALPALTVDDPVATVSNAGSIQFTDLTNSTTVQINGGAGGGFTTSGAINNTETYVATDSNGDGIVDGQFATALANRFGLRVAGAYNGSITQTAGSTQVRGDDSAGVEIDGAVTGDVRLSGSTTVLGSNSYGVRTTAPISGKLQLLGPVSATGEGSVAISIEGDVSGVVQIQNAVSATGYRVTTRPPDATLALMTPDEMLFGGSAVQITGNIGGGVLFDKPPTLSATNTDVDGDGIPDTQESISDVTVEGNAPAVQIGGATAINLGIVGGPTPSADLAYGMVNKGGITAVGIFDDVKTTAVRIDNANLNGGVSNSTATVGGFSNSGAITSGSFDVDSKSIALGSGATLLNLDNSGSIQSNLVVNKTLGGPAAAYGVYAESGADVAHLNNSGSIISTVTGDTGDAVAVIDQSDTLHSIVNTGKILPSHVSTDNLVTGANIAFDLSNQVGGTTITQSTPASSVAAPPSIVGDILFGHGADVLDVQDGTVTGNVSFGDGADQLSLTGGSTLTGIVTDSDSDLALNILSGRLNLENTSVLNATSLNVGATGALQIRLDPAAGQNGEVSVSGAAQFDPGSQITVLLHSAVPGDDGTFTLVHANSGITGTAPVDLTGSPFLYKAIVTEPPTTPDDISIELIRKSASELGLNKNETAIYQPFFNAATASSADPTVIQSFLGISTGDGFRSALDQVLPNATGAELDYAQTRNEAISSMLFARYLSPTQNNREIYAWAHEIGYTRERDATSESQGYHGYGFGFAAGVDGPMGRDGFKGLGLLVSSDEIREQEGFDKPLVVTSAELTAHAVQPFGRLLVAGRVGAAYDAFSFKRHLQITPDIATAPTDVASTSASWSGAHIAGSLHAALPTKLGAGFTLRPEVGLDGTYMWEGGYTESGGGSAIDLTVASRSGARADASAMMTLGHPFQTSSFLFNPEFTLGVRQPLITQSFDTTAHFNTDPDFKLTSDTISTPAVVAGLALNVDGEIGSVRFETQAESREGEISGMGRIVLRLTF